MELLEWIVVLRFWIWVSVCVCVWQAKVTRWNPLCVILTIEIKTQAEQSGKRKTVESAGYSNNDDDDDGTTMKPERKRIKRLKGSVRGRKVAREREIVSIHTHIHWWWKWFSVYVCKRVRVCVRVYMYECVIVCRYVYGYPQKEWQWNESM